MRVIIVTSFNWIISLFSRKLLNFWALFKRSLASISVLVFCIRLYYSNGFYVFNYSVLIIIEYLSSFPAK